ncbi:ABC transporter transmembrane domain-containing protein [Micromonospora sp. BRA006-A]|nr:ABC transporter transmembrane domain-containing protein [Micromonospora sp. BRA006-A]
MPRRTTARDLFRTALGATAWQNTLLVAGALGATATALTVPPHIAAAVQAAIDGTRGRALAVAATLLTVDTLCSLTVVWASSMISATASAALRRRMARHLLDREPHQLHAFSGGDLVSRFVADTATIGAAVPAAVSGAAGLITAAGGLVGLTLLDPRLLAVSLVAVPAGIHLAHRNLSDLHATTLAYRRSQSELSTNLVDALRGPPPSAPHIPCGKKPPESCGPCTTCIRPASASGSPRPATAGRTQRWSAPSRSVS